MFFFDDEDDEPVNGFAKTNRLAHDEDEGSEFRYIERSHAFEQDGEPFPRVRHTALWLIHNVVVHPILAVYPERPAVELHDLTSKWLNKEPPKGSVRVLRGSTPKITKKALWFVHNAVAHTAIGVLPCKATFDFHDWTARLMDVPGWV